MPKSSIRDSLRKRREGISLKDSDEAGQRLIPYLKPFKSFENWLLYSPIQGEISTRPLFDWLRKAEKSCFFPAILGDQLAFHRVSQWDELQSKNGVPEPPKSAQIFSPLSSGLVLVPAVAFSKKGDRLGFGRGYYDRFLKSAPQLLRVGLGYEFQILLKSWKTDAEDEPLDSILTPAGLWTTKRFL